MRIGIDARMYGPKSTTGIGNYIKNLTDNLFLIDQENEYILFMNEPAFSEFNPPNERIKKVKVNCPWYSLIEQIKMPIILLKHNLDLVHFPHFNATIFYPKKYIITIHDITPKFFPGPHVKKSLIRKIGYNVVFKQGTKKAKKIITISEYTKNNLVKYFNIPTEKIERIYLGASQDRKVITDQHVLDNIKQKYNIKKPFIFYVGVWRDHKNLPNLINAYNIVRIKYKIDCQLVLGGNPDNRYPEIMQTIKKLDCKQDIITPGFIPEEDMPALYNAASLFVLPSFCEGFGLVALESLACNTPVIGSDTTSLPEILGEASIYFDPGKPEDIARKINQVLTDPILYKNLQTRGLEQVKKYSWRDCAERTLEIYRSLKH